MSQARRMPASGGSYIITSNGSLPSFQWSLSGNRDGL